MSDADLMADLVVLLRRESARKLVGVDRAILDAIKDGDDASLPALREDRARLRALPETIKDGDRAALVAQWPADFPPLPEWFTDPDSVGPLGAPCVVDCKPPEPELVEAPAEDMGGPVRVEDMPIEDLREIRLAFALAERDQRKAELDLVAPQFVEPKARLELPGLYQRIEDDYQARVKRIQDATSNDALKDL